jgi:histidinol-phosphate aminotransferase
MRRPVHGSTDSLPDPRYDFSSNANPAGPCPAVLAAVRRADVTRYPDPAYLRLRTRLAERHHTTADRIVVGAGASELILRLIRRFAGTVQQLSPTFSEYAHGAAVAGRPLFSARSPEAFLEAQRRRPGIGFLCWPNNPTGELWPLSFVQSAAEAGPLVVDLAYAPLCEGSTLAAVEEVTAHAYRLYSPNKAFCLTGVRGGYVITPRADPHLAHAAPSWVIGRDAVALLEASTSREARAWLSAAILRFQRWRSTLALSLKEKGLAVRESPATFLLAKVGDATRVSSALRSRGVRVRDCSSFGLRQWIRLSAQRPQAQKALLAALEQAL